mmetsp:Transcript_17241/g.41379  ORF Transcript_17241/g.41379 Transcript_17241/m.41379 type:complete len:134 (+) Transcript_17241:115-516(+)
MCRRIISFIAPVLLASLAATAAAFSTHSTHQLPGRTRHSLQTPVLFAAEDEIGSTSSEAVPEAPKVAVKCPDCDLCDGSGRIIGGIGTVLEWWPIKAYRPCPNFVDRGGQYVRAGQGLDEIAFGRDSTFQSDN